MMLHDHHAILNHSQLDCLFKSFVQSNNKEDIKVQPHWSFVSILMFEVIINTVLFAHPHVFLKF